MRFQHCSIKITFTVVLFFVSHSTCFEFRFTPFLSNKPHICCEITSTHIPIYSNSKSQFCHICGDMMGHCSKKWGRTDMCGIYSFLFVDGPRCGSGSGFHVLLDDAWYPCSLCVLCQDRFDCGSPCPLDPSSQEVRNHSPLAFPGWMGLLLDSIGLKLQCHDN